MFILTKEVFLNRSRSIVGTALLALLVCAGAASAQTPANITVVSGNGQLICPVSLLARSLVTSFQPMVVKVTDASGNPVTNASVNWTVTSGDSSPVSSRLAPDNDSHGHQRFSHP